MNQAQRKSRGGWTARDKQVLASRYAHIPAKALALLLDKTVSQIYGMADRLGLNKADSFYKSDLSGRLNGRQGADTRFRKGDQPWNTGMKGWKPGGRAPETQFKKGNRPHTWVPIGTERVSRDGYLERKITDDGKGPRDWEAVHRIIWKEAYGPIPTGHVIVFKDREPKSTNIHLGRLELISRAELASRNTIHRYPPELKQVIRMTRKLERKLKEKSDEKQDD